MKHLIHDENHFVCTGRVTGNVQTPEELLAVFGLEVNKIYEVDGVPYPVPSRFKVVATDELFGECEKLSKGTPVEIAGWVEIDEEDLEVHDKVILREDGVTPKIDKTVTIYARKIRVLEEDFLVAENYFDCTGVVTGNVYTPRPSLAVFGLAVSRFYEVDGESYLVPSRFKVVASYDVAEECEEKLSPHTPVFVSGGLEIDEEESKVHGKIVFREDGVTPVMEKIIILRAEGVQALRGLAS